MISAAALCVSADNFTGTLTINDKIIPVKHAYALLHDNAEGLLSSPTELRILIADREIPIAALYGLSFLPVADMGRSGELQGVLLRFDPFNPRNVDFNVLMPKGLQTVTTRINIKELVVDAKAVTGAFDYTDTSLGNIPDYPIVKFNFRINLPVNFPPKVSADLQGKEALNSAQVKVVRAVVDAIAAADFVTLEKLSSASANRRNKKEIEYRGKGATAVYKQLGADMRKLIPRVKRVVVRGDRAVVIFPEQTMLSLVLEKGSWKAD